MPIERIDDLPPIITFVRDAIVQKKHIAAALGIGEDAVAGLHLPSFGVGQRERFVWAQVYDVLAERAMPTAPSERDAADRSSRRRPR